MILIGLGSSLAFCGRPPQDVIGLALAALDAHFGVARRSGFYVFPAWPDPSDPPFVNAAAVLAGAPPPADLLAGLHAIEAAFGRTRGSKNAP
ncbi:MAG: 2-amino-4-hydroxy-6-hydroxymethyldihydropteridine diphosphokinase, partial [Parvularculaceae bacterium]